MAWVMDCSFAAALGLPDEHSSAVEDFFLHVGVQDQLWVPPLWWIELSNVLLVAQRRGRITQAERATLFARFADLPVHTDAQIGEPVASRIQALAELHDLTAYDAAYLELAQRRGAGLATFDRQLAASARRSGVPLAVPG